MLTCITISIKNIPPKLSISISIQIPMSQGWHLVWILGDVLPDFSDQLLAQVHLFQLLGFQFNWLQLLFLAIFGLCTMCNLAVPPLIPWCERLRRTPNFNKLASLRATLVRNSADSLTHLLTGVKCRATSVAKKRQRANIQFKLSLTFGYF